MRKPPKKTTILLGSSSGELQDFTNRLIDKAMAYEMEVSTEKSKIRTKSTNNISAVVSTKSKGRGVDQSQVPGSNPVQEWHLHCRNPHQDCLSNGQTKQYLNGLLVSADERLVSVVAARDLSAALDTLDYPIPPQRLETTYGVRGSVLDWFVSYLSERCRSVIVHDVLSTSRPLVHGVPRGSVLGPVLFTLYTQPLSDVISVHNCDYHKYAADTELSQRAFPDQFDSVQSCIQTCTVDVLIWKNSNKLKLNIIKQRLCLLVPHLVSPWLRVSAQTSVESVPFKTSVKYIGVHLDRTLSMRQHIVCRSSFLELQRAASIRPYLSKSATAKWIVAMIISRLDYCNSVFAGLPHHHHHHQSLNREGRWGITDDFATSFLHFFLFSTALWDLPNSRPVHSLMLSPTSSFVRLVFFPLSLCLARWFWPDLMNGKHDNTTAVCVSLQSSGDLHVVQLPAGSWHGLPRW